MRARAKIADLPPSLDRAVLKALAPRATDRHENAADFRQALEKAIRTTHRRSLSSRAAAFLAIAVVGLTASVVFGMQMAGTRPGVPHAATATPATTPSEILTALPSIEIDLPAEAAPTVQAASAARDPAAAVPARKKAARADGTAAPALSVRTAAAQKEAPALQRDAELEQALGRHRELAATHPHDARAQQDWAESAAALRDWNEARKAAEAWALVDAAAEPRLFVARMLAYSGKKGTAVSVLEDLLESHPECDEARALLSDYRPDVFPSEKRKPGAGLKQTAASALEPLPNAPPREP
jgi:tetratricopeptide (TPR) repeat protein